MQRIQDDLRARRRGSGTRTDWRIRQLTIQDTFSIASHTPKLVDSWNRCPPKTCARYYMKYSYVDRNESRQRVWQRPGKHFEPSHFPERQANRTPGVMVWGGIMFDHMASLVETDGRLTADYYVTQVVKPVALPLVQNAPKHIILAKQCQFACCTANS
ncbi:hypothetical protein TNCV_4600851 [Trichonephila clavipes]|nr:hypothetical protein TNCV_4600851 [Trichonephila clavipes]